MTSNGHPTATNVADVVEMGLLRSAGATAAARAGIRSLLTLMGEDPDREGLADTPDRVIRAMLELTAARPGPAELLHVQFGCPDVDQMIAVGPIPLVSLCEHHLLPFTGTAWVAYIPEPGRVVGLSKLARLVDWAAGRAQVQERMVQQITAAMVEHLAPDAACVVDATHSCMTTRGVRKVGAVMRTASLTGRFRTQPDTRAEFLATVGPVRSP